MAKKIIKKPRKNTSSSNKEDLIKELKSIKKKHEELLKTDIKDWIVIYKGKDNTLGYGLNENEKTALLDAKRDAKNRGPLPRTKKSVIIKIGVS